MKEQILSEFTKRFEGTPVVYASSGRINLIGEHTDYNGGFVFPGAIDKYIMAAILPNGSDKVRVFSIDINDYAEFGLNEEDAPEAQWARYIFGVCRETIKRDGTVEGLRHKKYPAFSVQFHPDATPGPHDEVSLFDDFMSMIDQRKEEERHA